MAGSARTLAVMIVNDHPIMRDGLRLAVQNEPDMRVVCEVANQADAIAQFNSCKPDVILIDLQGCGSPGFLAIRAIRHRSPSTPIVILATFADEATRLRGLSLDHTVCLSKTATPGEVLEALRTLGARSPW
jgi:DNA-binding NarL/FixJ family response regulator